MENSYFKLKRLKIDLTLEFPWEYFVILCDTNYDTLKWSEIKGKNRWFGKKIEKQIKGKLQAPSKNIK